MLKLKVTALYLCLLSCTVPAISQKSKADSVATLLAAETVDSNRVKYLWRMADYISFYNPDSALIVANKGLQLATEINYSDGQSRSLGIIANSYFRLGNYPKTLEYNLRKLKIEEKNNNPRNLSSVLMNIGLVYNYQEEFRKSLEYLKKSDSVIKKNNIETIMPHIALNIGDAYDKLNELDSAFLFYNTSLKEAKKHQNDDLIGAALTGLAHIYRKQSNFQLSRDAYYSAIKYLQLASDDDLVCEAELGLAKLYDLFQQPDSAIHHAAISYRLAKNDNFDLRELDAAKLLNSIFYKSNRIDSAYLYLTLSQELNDTINNKNRVRESQVLSSNEQLRQLEIEGNKRKAEKERNQQLQLLFIGIFIPGLFLLTLLFSKIRLHIRLVKVLGILSLLIFFEYLTLLLHPTVAAFTNYTPVLEILIFVGIAAVLIPLHHRAEHWLISRLLHHRLHQHHDEKNKEVKKNEV